MNLVNLSLHSTLLAFVIVFAKPGIVILIADETSNEKLQFYCSIN